MSADDPDGMAFPVLLTEAEAANAMGWTVKRVRSLRLAGHLPFLPGQPVLIDREDLAAAIISEQNAVEAKREAKRIAKIPKTISARTWALRKRALRGRSLLGGSFWRDQARRGS